MTSQKLDLIVLVLRALAALTCYGILNLRPNQPPVWTVGLIVGMASMGCSGLMPYLPGGAPWAPLVASGGTLSMIGCVFISYYRATDRTTTSNVRHSTLRGMAFGASFLSLLVLILWLYVPSRERYDRVTIGLIFDLQGAIRTMKTEQEDRYEALIYLMAQQTRRDSVDRARIIRNQQHIMQTQEQVKEDLRKQQQKDGRRISPFREPPPVYLPLPGRKSSAVDFLLPIDTTDLAQY